MTSMSPDVSATSRVLIRRRFRIDGTVQGVGFRPYVHGVAAALGVTGFVGNGTDGVVVEAQGDTKALEELRHRLAQPPAPAYVASITELDRPVEEAAAGFTILATPPAAASGSTSIPPDLATCPDCLAELRDPADRRFRYPFIACAHCGPRYTMTVGLPYDRDTTTMVDFPLCPECAAEYADPSSRRFHAQPTACPACGPRLSMPVDDVAAALRAGQIVALKGIGGYHLACDAGDPRTVARLRERKRRRTKPFAIMTRDLDVARRIVAVDAAAQELLSSPARPIVILPARDLGYAAQVAPAPTGGAPTIGVMLPYAGLHHLLFDAGAPDVLVVTSGNLSDEPICTDPAEAAERLAGITDVFCHHDRRIHVACDDSVIATVDGVPRPVRRSRGYAPAPVRLTFESPPLLAVGGELKTTIAVSRERLVWLSQHIGDTENLATLAMLARTADALAELQRVEPVAVVSDRHPAYHSRRWAAEYAARHGIPHVTVQHHHAHLAALLAEHGVPEGEPVLGVVFDGSGYGDDGTLWGGEFLLGSYAAVRRVAHLRPVLLPGGDVAVRHPARSALAHLTTAGLSWDDTVPAAQFSDAERHLLARMLATGTQCTPTSSVGRLFDAVSSLLGVCQIAEDEGQAAVELESLARAATGNPALRDTPPSSPAAVGGSASTDASPLRADQDAVHDDADSLILNPTAWLEHALAASATSRAEAALRFHADLAGGVLAVAEQVARRDGVRAVGLTGGVFANAVLTQLCRAALEAAGFVVLTHETVPPNDGGLALGQIAVVAAGGGHPHLLHRERPYDQHPQREETRDVPECAGPG